MKIFDCTLFTDEKIMFGARLNILNKYVDKFIVSEANYTHSGSPKNFNFNIDDYPEFKDKIIYIKINKLPEFSKADLFSKRTKSIKIISYQRNKLLTGLAEADNNDFIIFVDVIYFFVNYVFFNYSKNVLIVSVDGSRSCFYSCL